MTANNSRMLHFLIELRKRLLLCLLTTLLLFVGLCFFANPLYTLLAHPLLQFLPQGHTLIATNITAPFLVPFELTFVVALFLAMPIFLYQAWKFIAPALYQHERRLVWPILFISIFLFYSGVGFAYWIVFPVLFKFLTHAAPQGVIVSPDISQYLNFTLKLFFVFGIIFEIPIIALLLMRLKIVSLAQLIHFRPYAIVAAFILGMFIAPPDIFSQTLVAIPIWLLYETGILLGKIFNCHASEGWHPENEDK